VGRFATIRFSQQRRFLESAAARLVNRQSAMGNQPIVNLQSPIVNGLPWWAVQDSNLRQPACKAGALPLS
jgi:hypothetical protein